MSGDDSGRPEARQDASAGGDATASVDVAGRDIYAAGRDIHLHEASARDITVINVHHAPSAAPAAPVRIWGNVPTRNPAFTGRSAQLDAIRSALVSGITVAVQALHGMSGVGKTQLAIEYAHRFCGDYDIIWWLDAENAVLLGQQYAELAETLGCAEPGTPQHALRRAVLNVLHQQDRWLLIFDNAEDPNALRDWLPSEPGHVLITSRLAVWSEVAVPVPVDVLTRTESLQLLRTWVPGLTDTDADTLAAALGDLPLALAQAAAYLAETCIPAAEYATLLQDRGTELLSQYKPLAYRDTLPAVTTLAYDRLHAADAGAADLAAICAFLAPEPIPVSWLVFAAASFPDGLAARLADPLKRSKLLAALVRSSLARLNHDGLVMHRLTQAILRDRAQLPDRIRDIAEAVVTAGRPGDVGDTPTTWPAWARVLPHLLALDPARTDSQDVQNAAAHAVWYLTRSGNPAGALDFAAHLHERWRDRLGLDHPQTLRIANAHGNALYALGGYAHASEIDQDTLARRRRLYGDDHPDTLASANNLASDLYWLGQHHAARELNEDTLARYQRLLGSDHPDTLRTANNLALDLSQLGDGDGARTLIEDTLRRRRQLLGDDHPDTMRTGNNLAIILYRLGVHNEARALEEATLAQYRRVLGEAHPDTVVVARNLVADP
jgi:hypothetical protein